MCVCVCVKKYVLVLNNLHGLLCHKNQPTNQRTFVRQPESVFVSLR